MKIIVCGDRNWSDEELIRKIFDLFPNLTAVVHGDCRGADKLSGKVARHRGVLVLPVPAQWDKYGKTAGPVRNAKMLEDNPDIKLVIALHDDLASSRGTVDMIRRARKAGVKVEHWSHKRWSDEYQSRRSSGEEEGTGGL